MKKAILLVRVSTKGQEKSLDEQSVDLKKIALSDGYKEKELEIIEEIGSGINLSEAERQGLNKMKECIENPSNQIQVLYVWELSRLSRQPATLYNLRDYFVEKKINLKAFSPTFTLLDKQGNLDSQSIFHFGVYVMICEAEMRDKKARFKRVKESLASAGKYVGGAIKFGYRLGDEKKQEDKKKYYIDETDGELVKLTFNLYEEIKSYPKTWMELKERGYNIKYNTVMTIITSKAYTGKVEFDSYTRRRTINGKLESYTQTVNERVFPQLISKEQFERCELIRLENNTGANSPKHIYYSYNLIKCPDCGRYWKPAFNTKCYMCKDKYKNYYKEDKSEVCYNHESVNINVVDSLLWSLTPLKEAEYLTEQAEQDILKYNAEIEVYNQKIEATETNFNLLKGKKDRVVESYMDGDITKENRDKRMKAIKEDEAVIYNQITDWNDKIDKLNNLIKLINQNTFYMDIPQEKDISITEKVEYIKSITDDQMRYDLIHKHIKEVDIKEYEPRKVKLITVHFNDGKTREFYYYYKTINKRLTFKLDGGEEVELLDYFIQRFDKQPTKHRKHIREKKKGIN